MENLLFFILFILFCSGCCGCSFTWGRKQGAEEAQERDCSVVLKAEEGKAAKGGRQ